MKITKKKMIEELNKDLEWEYSAAIQYLQHAAVISGAEYDSIQKELIIHSQEEMLHAVMLSDQIDFLGGVPTVDVEKREISDDSQEMLKQDLKGEDNAIKRYKERIGQAEALKEYGLRRVLEDILIQEEEHKRDLVGAIAKKK
ncbi:MAG: ferritin-like domain-containing protein [Sulfuricella sp.]|nr:ferritin-like domain-containing protein [Sulfuricella sp.]